MKQLRKTEWRRGYPIKKNLALCAWGLMALAGFAGILSHPENIPSLAASVLALAGAVLTLPRILSHPENIPSLAASVLALAGAVLTLPPLLRYYRTTYHSLPALNRRLTKEEQEELIFQKNL